MKFMIFALLVASAAALKVPQMPRLNAMNVARKLPAAALAASVTMSSELAHARTWTGVDGQLDFGPLAGDQPGGEGTGRALGINDDSLLVALLVVSVGIGLLFAQWQTYQDDDDDFFDSYDSRRSDKDLTNRNRV